MSLGWIHASITLVNTPRRRIGADVYATCAIGGKREGAFRRGTATWICDVGVYSPWGALR